MARSPSSSRMSLGRRLVGYALLAAIAFAPKRRQPTVQYRGLRSERPRSILEPAIAQKDREPERMPSGEQRLTQAPMGDASWWGLIKTAATQWMGHKASRLGAALAYYSIFSIGPLIVIAIAIAGLLFGGEAVRGEVSNGLKGLLGDNGAQGINEMLAGANQPHQGIFATIIGIGTLIFAAVGVVVQLKDALNTVWEVESPTGSGIFGFVRTYILSLAGVLSLGFLLLVSMLVTTALSAGGKYLAPYLPEILFQIVSSAVSFWVIALLFAMMFKWLPDEQISWGDVWIGGLATAALFEVGKFLIGLYIGKQGLESTYGAAASIVIVLIWVYYSAQIVLFGAEFTNVYARQRGSFRNQTK
jgi:membrane protein